jgi:hypothetical protein
MFCPKGSARPIPVGEGYYTLGRISIIGIMQSSEDENIRSAQTKCDPGHYCIDGVKYQCPGGTYGNVFGLFKPECSGKCHPGHYCPPASILPTQRRCGKSDVYCPEGSAAPIRAKQGYCTKGLVAIDAQKDSSSTRAVEYIAPRGFYEYSGACIECPPGHYGDQEGETNSLCQGKCLAGYYCPRGSSSATQFECGSSDFYCPEGSSLPYPVDLGFYTTTIGLKQLEATCPPGEYRDLTTTSSSYYDLITGKSPLTTNYGDTKYPFAR